MFRNLFRHSGLALVAVLGLGTIAPALGAVNVLVEAESFAAKGGWVVDPQFVQQMGSPFLLAHGGGKPVADASTTVSFPEPGSYRVWVRTRDWVPTHADDPGQFKLRVDGVELTPVFGTDLGTWHWQDGGMVTISGASATVGLDDLTGFDGRCDAIAFIKGSDEPPPAGGQDLAAWRATMLGESEVPVQTDTYDCVVVGGGIAGCAASLAASRSGVRVALIHDRPVLGGNASQEIRVATRGEIRHAIVDQIDTYHLGNRSSGTIVEDTNRLAVLQAETNLTLVMPWRAYAAGTNASGRVAYVDARNIVTGERRRFAANIFIDCTGDGWIGYWAGADYRMGREGASEFGESRAPATADQMTMGNSLMWTTVNTGSDVSFPSVPMSMAWATAVAGTRADTGGEWFWEYGMRLSTIEDAEEIRDHLLCAIYGNFYNAKQNPANLQLDFSFLPYIAGKRESRRLMGDYLVTQPDVQNGVYFEDAVGTATWGIDLHYETSTSYISTYTSTAVARWYYPFRSLYSRNVPNLLMAGRNLSVSHVGLGSPRVMNTTGQMGVAVGYAAALCKQYGIEPRDIYRSADRTVELQARIGGSWPQRPVVVSTGIIVDNTNSARVTIQGAWTSSTYDSGYYGTNYLHDGNTNKGQKSVTFRPVLTNAGSYEVFLRWTSSNNRATNTPVTLVTSNGAPPIQVLVNQQANGGSWNSLGTYSFDPAAAQVIVANSNTTGHVIADAVQFVDPSGAVAAGDRDADGLPDWWERWYFLSETKADRDTDTDGDRMTNYQEYLTGTDPLNAASRFDMRAWLDAVPEQAVLTWPSTTNRTYRIEASEDMVTFQPYIEGIPATPPQNTHTVPLTGTMRCFRVVAE
jgi:hypothetical protein